MSLTESSQNAESPSAKEPFAVEPFGLTLARNGLELTRGQTTTLQVNVGLLCNQACRHCHLEAGPDRREVMDAATADDVASFARRTHFAAIDITGGAPELNEDLTDILESLSPLTPRIMLRSNLTALDHGSRERLIEVCLKHRVVIVASFPSLQEAQAESQRGQGIFQKSVAALQRLNARGYGQVESSLELNLVSNPTGAFLASSQAQTENRFRLALEKKWGIVFNNLFTFSNVPLGRFRQWLQRSGNFEGYMQRLVAAFNPCAVAGLMCRTLVSVAWDGYLYDCDFNLAKGIFMAGRKTHINELPGPPDPGTPIACSDHCYACTAGQGFT
jgi:radical SAM/Cys-rich protein